jgi:hypothetical protein
MAAHSADAASNATYRLVDDFRARLGDAYRSLAV